MQVDPLCFFVATGDGWIGAYAFVRWATDEGTKLRNYGAQVQSLSALVDSGGMVVAKRWCGCSCRAGVGFSGYEVQRSKLFETRDL